MNFMAQVSKVLREADGNRLFYWCPGCQSLHGVSVEPGPGARWGWNGDVHAPTFSPSLLITTGHYVSGYRPGSPCWCSVPDARYKCVRCHSFVRNGQIEFLPDSTHELSGKTVPLPELPDYLQDPNFR